MINKVNDRGRDRAFNAINYTILTIFFILVAYPLIYILSASISDPILVNQGKVWLLPKGITFLGFQRVFKNSEIIIGYKNTILYTVLGTLLNLTLTFTAAYPLSRKDFKARKFFTAIFTFTMFFSGGLIPLYLVVKKLNITDTVIVILVLGAVSIWNIIITRTYYQTTIPDELQEAAIIDGCSNFRLLFRIIIPLSKPIIAVMALFYGVGHWNSYFNEMIFLNNRKLFPLQLILREILVQNQMQAMLSNSAGDMETLALQAQIADSLKYSVMIVSSLPILIIYPFLQKYFVKGIMIGAIKG